MMQFCITDIIFQKLSVIVFNNLIKWDFKTKFNNVNIVKSFTKIKNTYKSTKKEGTKNC